MKQEDIEAIFEGIEKTAEARTPFKEVYERDYVFIK